MLWICLTYFLLFLFISEYSLDYSTSTRITNYRGSQTAQPYCSLISLSDGICVCVFVWPGLATLCLSLYRWPQRQNNSQFFSQHSYLGTFTTCNLINVSDVTIHSTTTQHSKQDLSMPDDHLTHANKYSLSSTNKNPNQKPQQKLHLVNDILYTVRD